MPAPTMATVVTQLGAEATASPGVAVTCNRRLKGASIGLNPAGSHDLYKPEGSKFPTMGQLTGEWTTGPINGRPTFNELPYFLSSLWRDVTPTQIMDGATPTGAYTWTWAPSATAGETPRSYTLERGTPGGTDRAQRAAYVLVNELTMGWERNGEPSLGGAVMGQRMTDAITMNNAGVTVLDPVPIMVGTIDLFYDATSAALGTTKLARVRNVEARFGDRWRPFWTLDSSKASWAEHTENAAPSSSIRVRLADDAQRGTLYTDWQAGTKKFLRLRATGPRIYTGGVNVDHSMTLDFCTTVIDHGEFTDDDGAKVVDVTLAPTDDATWGKPMNLVVVNKLAAL